MVRGVTRVLVAGLPRLLQELICRSLRGARGLEVSVASHVDPDDQVEYDVLVTRPDGEDEPGLPVARLLERWPRTKVVVIGPDEARSRLYEVVPRRRELGSDLIEAILDVSGRVEDDALVPSVWPREIGESS